MSPFNTLAEHSPQSHSDALDLGSLPHHRLNPYPRNPMTSLAIATQATDGSTNIRDGNPTSSTLVYSAEV